MITYQIKYKNPYPPYQEQLEEIPQGEYKARVNELSELGAVVYSSEVYSSPVSPMQSLMYKVSATIHCNDGVKDVKFEAYSLEDMIGLLSLYEEVLICKPEVNTVFNMRASV